MVIGDNKNIQGYTSNMIKTPLYRSTLNVLQWLFIKDYRVSHILSGSFSEKNNKAVQILRKGIFCSPLLKDLLSYQREQEVIIRLPFKASSSIFRNVLGF